MLLVYLSCAQYDGRGSYAGALLLNGATSRAASSSWWSSSYACRTPITIQAGASSLPAGTLVDFQFNHSALVSAAKSMANGNDVRLTYDGSPPSEIARALAQGSSWNSASTTIAFKLVNTIASGASDTGYSLYYCDANAGVPTNTVPATQASIVSAPAPVTQNSTAWTPVTSLVVQPSSATEVWLWFVTFAVQSNAPPAGQDDSNQLAQVTINGTTDTGLEQQSNPASHYKTLIAAGAITGTTTAQTIALQMKGETAGTTTTAKNVRIVAVLLPPDADFHSAVNDTTTTVQQVWGLANASLTFTPVSAGDYFVMALGQHNEAPSSTISQMRFRSFDGTFWPAVGGPTNYYSANDRGPWDSFFVFRKVTLTAASQTFQMQFQSSNNGADAGGSKFKGTRIFAFRADAFDLVEGVENLAETTTTSTTAQVRSTLTTVAPSSSRDYLMIQTHWLYDNDAGAAHFEMADFRQNGTVLSDQDHALDRAETYQFASGCVWTTNTASSMTLENRYWSNNATPTYSKESIIYALRFKSPGIVTGAEQTQ